VQYCTAGQQYCTPSVQQLRSGWGALKMEIAGSHPGDFVNPDADRRG
jgi:hypothetical protein